MPEHNKTNPQLEAEIKELQHKVDSLRELGDALWYCLRHRNLITKEETQDAIEEWIEHR